VLPAACLIAPAIRMREGSTATAAVAFDVSTDIDWSPAPSEGANEQAKLLIPHVTLRRSWLTVG